MFITNIVRSIIHYGYSLLFLCLAMTYCEHTVSIMGTSNPIKYDFTKSYIIYQYTK